MGESRRGFLGTPIESAESSLLSRKQPKTARAPRVWEQIVTDDRGRRRLHGAFTGGFSAGYFNTVDTKEGFVPKSFRTTRSQRAEERTQAVQDFYDEDELREMAQVDIMTQERYDTFASAHHTRVRERTEREAMSRPIIPGEIIGEFVEGVAESIGVQLLQKMGWRQGKGIGESFQQSAGSKWGPEASLSQQSTHIWSEKPKGLGFDPFRGSRAFERHRMRAESPSKASSKRSRGIAFGVGVLEETDTFGEIGDYVEASQDHMNYYDMSDHSDDGRPSRHAEKEPKRITHRSSEKKGSLVPGFQRGSVLREMKVFQLPVVPPHFTGKRAETKPSNAAEQMRSVQSSIPAPRLPADEKLKRTIDSLAVFVAKGGMMSEELVRQEHQGDEAFSFLFGGEGSEYYRWKLLDVKVTFQKLGVQCTGLREAPLTADDRGFLLGDERIQETPIASHTVSHPFIQGVPEQDRDRVKSALKSTFVKGSSEGMLHMEESTAGLRAPKPKNEQQMKTEEPVQKTPQPTELTPVRSFIDWHPVPLLYKRFNVLDPLKGLPREVEPKSKFMSYEAALDEVKTDESSTAADPAALPTTSVADDVDVSLPPPEYTEPPLDIFKSIFDASEEEDDEDEAKETDKGMSPEPEPQIKAESNPDIPSEIKETRDEQASPHRKRLNISSEESEAEEEKSKKKKKKSRKGSEEEPFDEEVLKGLSTSEFKKLLKTLKKGRAKKKRKKESKRRKRSEERRRSRSDV